jgi:hypothetical protein
MICPTGEAKYFCKWGWTPLSTNRPTGKSLEPVLLSVVRFSLVSRMEIRPSFPNVQLHIVGALLREPGIHMWTAPVPQEPFGV